MRISLCRAIKPDRAHVPGVGDDEEPVRHGRADADRGAVALPAVVGDRHDTVEVPVGGRAAEPRRVRVLHGDAPERNAAASRRRRRSQLKDQFGTSCDERRRRRTSCACRPRRRRRRRRLGRRSSTPISCWCASRSRRRTIRVADGLRQEPVRCRRGEGRAQHASCASRRPRSPSRRPPRPPSTTTTTAPGVVTNYSCAEHRGPVRHRRRPRRRVVVHELLRRAPIGRITTDGTITNFPNSSISRPGRHRAGRRRRDVVREHRDQHDRAGHHRRHRSLSRPTATRGSRPRTASRPGPGGVTWFTSGASNSVGWVDGQRRRERLLPLRASRTRRASPPGPTAPCGSPTSTAARSGASRPTGDVTLYGDSTVVAPLSITTGPRRRVVVHESRQQLDRADHDRRHDHQLHRLPASRARSTSSPVPTATLWFTNYGNNTIGRITTERRRSPTTPTRRSAAPTASRPAPTARSGSRTPGNNTIGRISV